MVFSPFTLPILTTDILIILFIFVFITVILLIILLKSKIHWLFKFTLIIVSTFVYISVYQGMMSFQGWPSEQILPNKFQIHWTFIREPDKYSKAKGAIYMWVAKLDEYNVPSGIPRAYKLPYSESLEEEVSNVQGNLEMGIEQSATVEKLSEDQIQLYNEKNRETTTSEQDRESGGYQYFESIDGVYQITFGELPETTLPDKSPF